MNKKPFLSSLIALVFLLSATIASAAFTPPSAPPPGNNTLPPLHVGSDAQSKKGNLVIEGLDDAGFAKSLGLGVLNGNVGLGTLFPTYKLTIREGDASFATDNRGVRWNGIPGWDWYIQAKDTGASNVPLHFKSNYNGSGLLSRMTISSNGNVGIGTETPAGKLHIQTNGGGDEGVRVSAGQGSGYVRLASGTTYPGYIDWINGAGTRLSYLGYDSATNMNWTLENGANLQISGGNVEFGGQIKIAGGSPGAGKVLTSDANGLARWETPSGASCASGVSGADVFDTTGTYTWTVPAGVTSVKVKLWGAGGNGGSAPGQSTGGGGGGGGAYGEKVITIPNGVTRYQVVIGGPGASTSFGGTLAVVNAGQNGQAGSDGGAGGAGGTVIGGGWLISVNGGGGENGSGTRFLSSSNGCSGKSFTQDGNGGAGGSSYAPSTSGIGGVEPTCRVGPYTTPTNGTIGGGGGGAQESNPGIGGLGKVIIEYSGSGTCSGGSGVTSTSVGICDANPVRTITQSNSGTEYQNTTGSQLMVVATASETTFSGQNALAGYIGATSASTLASQEIFTSTNRNSITFLVPPGYYYKVVNGATNSPTLSAKVWKLCGGGTSGGGSGDSSPLVLDTQDSNSDTFANAFNSCRQAGKRLPTAEELLQFAVSGTASNPDNDFLWSITPDDSRNGFISVQLERSQGTNDYTGLATYTSSSKYRCVSGSTSSVSATPAAAPANTTILGPLSYDTPSATTDTSKTSSFTLAAQADVLIISYVNICYAAIQNVFMSVDGVQVAKTAVRGESNGADCGSVTLTSKQNLTAGAHTVRVHGSGAGLLFTSYPGYGDTTRPVDTYVYVFGGISGGTIEVGSGVGGGIIKNCTNASTDPICVAAKSNGGRGDTVNRAISCIGTGTGQFGGKTAGTSLYYMSGAWYLYGIDGGNIPCVDGTLMVASEGGTASGGTGTTGGGMLGDYPDGIVCSAASGGGKIVLYAQGINVVSWSSPGRLVYSSDADTGGQHQSMYFDPTTGAYIGTDATSVSYSAPIASCNGKSLSQQVGFKFAGVNNVSSSSSGGGLSDIRSGLTYSASCTDGEGRGQTTASCTATCAAGKKVVSGSCVAKTAAGTQPWAPAPINTSAPTVDGSGWSCNAVSPASNVAVQVVGSAICI